MWGSLRLAPIIATGMRVRVQGILPQNSPVNQMRKGFCTGVYTFISLLARLAI